MGGSLWQHMAACLVTSCDLNSCMLCMDPQRLLKCSGSLWSRTHAQRSRPQCRRATVRVSFGFRRCKVSGEYRRSESQMLSVLRSLGSVQISPSVCLLWWEIRGFEFGDAFADSVNSVNSVKELFTPSLEVTGKVVKPLRSTTTRSSWFGRLVRLGKPKHQVDWTSLGTVPAVLAVKHSDGSMVFSCFFCFIMVPIVYMSEASILNWTRSLLLCWLLCGQHFPVGIFPFWRLDIGPSLEIPMRRKSWHAACRRGKTFSGRIPRTHQGVWHQKRSLIHPNSRIHCFPSTTDLDDQMVSILTLGDKARTCVTTCDIYIYKLYIHRLYIYK